MNIRRLLRSFRRARRKDSAERSSALVGMHRTMWYQSVRAKMRLSR